MANRIAAPNLFAPNPPNWSLAQLDANAQAATGAINDSSLGAVNGPLTDTGSVNAYVVTCALGTPSAYNNGMTVFFRPANTNTGASTLTVSPLGSLPIVAADSSALVGGELVAGSTVGVVCDGSAFRIVSQPGASQIYSVRLRSFNAIGNPSFEVDQRLCGNALALAAGNTSGMIDRWQVLKNTATATIGIQTVVPAAGPIVVPGTNFEITSKALLVQLNTVQATLAASEFIEVIQFVEGPFLRELINDVHSISLFAWCTQPITFSVSLINAASTYSLTKQCQITTANQPTLFTLPNLPIWTSSATWSLAPGNVGYVLRIGLGAGSSYISPANNTWQAGNFVQGPGCTNFASLPLSTQFFLGFCQHEPGPLCTTLIDKPFSVAYDEALRYFCKSWAYPTAVGTATQAGMASAYIPANLQAVIPVTFAKPMAKAPTITGYNPNSGASGSVRDYTASVDRTISSTLYASDRSFGGFGMSTTNAAQAQYGFHYTADTGF